MIYMHSAGVGARVYHLDGIGVEKLLILRFKSRSVTQGILMKISFRSRAL